eukprot:4579171-Amphidinium_carterae.1
MSAFGSGRSLNNLNPSTLQELKQAGTKLTNAQSLKYKSHLFEKFSGLVTPKPIDRNIGKNILRLLLYTVWHALGHPLQTSRTESISSCSQSEFCSDKDTLSC